MFKKSILIAFFSILIASSISFCEYDGTSPDFEVIINSGKLINEVSDKPFYVYDGILYVPLTWKNQRTLGIQVINQSDKLNITLADTPKMFANDDYRPRIIESEIGIPVNGPIYINGVFFNNKIKNHPLLWFNTTIYLPLSDEICRDILNWDVHNEGNTLIINSDKPALKQKLTGEEFQALTFSEEDAKIIELALSLKNDLESSINIKSSYFNHYFGKLYRTEALNGSYQGILESQNFTYTGEFKNDLFEGLGVIKFSNDISYVGQFKEGKYNGIGRFYNGEEPIGKIMTFNMGSAEGSDLKYLDIPPKYSKDQNALLIMVEFNDRKLSTNELQWYNYMFADKYSVKTFYEDVSYGKINLHPATENFGEKNNGIIKISLDIPHPNSGNEFQKCKDAVLAALMKSDEYIDFKGFDTNKNGSIDEGELAILTVFAGFESSGTDMTPSINAHKFTLGSKTFYFDNVSISNYVVIGELSYDKNISIYPYQNTPAVASHELGHVFGLPDLYDTDYTSRGIGFFGLMGLGGHLKENSGARGLVPVDFSPWSRIYLKLSEPTTVNVSGDYQLFSKETGEYNILKIPINDHEYFLLENRTFTLYDAPLSSINSNSGILIWHIDEDVINNKFITNTINDDELRKGIDLEESNEIIVGNSTLDKVGSLLDLDPYYRKSKVSMFNNYTSPSSKDNDGNKTGISIQVLEDGKIAKVKIIIPSVVYH